MTIFTGRVIILTSRFNDMKSEIRKIFSSKMLVATLVAVTILPLIYGALYLWAFWDPYSKIENIPVAIVNLDTGSTKKDDKKIYNFGNDLVENLKENPAMRWEFVSESVAEDGLKSRKYYTEAIVPSDFSKNILSVDSDNPAKAEIQFKSRPASSFMAAKFADSAFVRIKAALNEKISKEYFDNIFSKTRDSAVDLGKAVDGAKELNDGMTDAKKGSQDLYDGTDKLNSGIVDLRNGLIKLRDGSNKLHDGFNVIQEGKTISFSNGIDQAAAGSKQLLTGAVALDGGAGQVLAGLGTNSTAIEMVSSLVNQYLAANPEATGSAELQQAAAILSQIKVGMGQLSAGQTSVKSGASQLKAGLENLSVGLSSAKDGKDKLNSGVEELTNNLGVAVTGANDLLAGVEKIKSGQKDLIDGLQKAKDGTTELRDKLAKAWRTAMESTDSNKNAKQETVMSAPVDIHDVSIDLVENNGTGFAPYFIPLSLWVGAMAIFFLVELEGRKKLWQKSVVCMIVGVVQMLVLGIVLRRGLSLKVNNVVMFYLLGIVLSWVYILIQMWLNLRLGLAGKFVAIIILMLQLTSSAGSYPLETLPSFFQKINPVLPMTYAVSALKEIISGGEMSIIGMDLRVLVRMGLLMAVFISFYRFQPLKWLKTKCRIKGKK